MPVANSNAGHFIWVNLGGKLGFEEGEAGVKEEKKVFQELLDGGVYIVSFYCLIEAGSRIDTAGAWDSLSLRQAGMVPCDLQYCT